MTSKHLKDENKEWVLGVNGKKLRYIIDKKEKKIAAKFKKNWTDDAIDILEIKYDDYFIEYESNKRGRPSKNKTPKNASQIILPFILDIPFKRLVKMIGCSIILKFLSHALYLSSI